MKDTHFSAHILLYGASLLCAVIASVLLFIPKINEPAAPVDGARSTLSSSLLSEITPFEETITPQSYGEWVAQGKAFEEQGELRRALSAYLAAGSMDATPTEPYLRRSSIYVSLREYDKALKEVETLLQKDSKNPDYQVRYASVRLHQIEAESNTAILQDAKDRLAQISPKTQESIFLECLIATFTEHTQATIELCSNVPNTPSEQLGALATELVEQEKAFTTFSDGDPSFVDTLHAKTYTAMGFYRLAAAKLRGVIERRGDYRDAWTLLGYTYLALGQADTAKLALSQSYQLDTTRPDSQYLLALSHDRLGEKDQAINFYTLAISNQYKDPITVKRRLVELFKETSRYEKALDTMMDLIQIDTSSTVTDYIDPIWIYIDILQRPQEALAIAKEAKQRFPEEADSYNLLGWASFAGGQLDEAKAYLEESIRRSPLRDAPHYNLGRVVEAQGHKEEALSYYKLANDLGNGSSIASLAAKAYNRILSEPETTQ